MTDVTSATDASQTDSAGPQPEAASGEWCAAVENGGGEEKGAPCPDNSTAAGNTQLPQHRTRPAIPTARRTAAATMGTTGMEAAIPARTGMGPLPRLSPT